MSISLFQHKQKHHNNGHNKKLRYRAHKQELLFQELSTSNLRQFGLSEKK